MNAKRNLALSEGFADETARRKRLGQYFTGTPLARLLAAISDADSARSIVDPMAGSGDMLLACREYGAATAEFAAVEIDPIAAETCATRAPWAKTVQGNAFDPETLSHLAASEWDLVITNPPYVRYQSLASAAGNDFPLPSSRDIRAGLLEFVRTAPSLDSEDRRLFSELASGYSGLADLAVPSWILCAALCAPTGKIAVVLPESWLSREYAAIVQYLLLRWFRIKYVVEDADATWFSDAQVKTALLVAERVPRRDGAFDRDGADSFVTVRLSSGAAGPRGVVDRLHAGSAGDPEWQFSELLRDLSRSGKNLRTAHMEAVHVPISRLADNARSLCSGQKWLRKVEPSLGTKSIAGHSMPHTLEVWLTDTAEQGAVTTLEDVGARIGQGLRTGANGFFYVDLRAPYPKNGFSKVRASAQFGGADFDVPTDAVLPVLRKQSELPEGYVVSSETLSGAVLALQSYALPEDRGHYPYREMPPSLADFVRTAASAEIDGKKIHELSAVAPNVRKGSPATGAPPRFWYMLPDFAARHRPDLFVPRVNGGSPKAYLNGPGRAVVDANFSTVTCLPNSPADAWSILALLNSTWCRAVLEESASVMGGGALKIEAAHLRRLPIPVLDNAGWKRLSALGSALANGEDVLRAVDELVASALLGRRAMKKEYAELVQIGENSRLRRERIGRKSSKH